MNNFLNNLSRQFQDQKLPNIVCLGDTQTGKTTNYLELVSHENFGDKTTGIKYIFPFLISPTIFSLFFNLSSNRNKSSKNVLDKEIETYRLLKVNHLFSYSDFITRIYSSSLNEVEWSQFWINEIANALFLLTYKNEKISLEQLNQRLIKKDLSVIFLFDGLEEIFSDIKDKNQQDAIKSLISNIPNKISELKQARIGLIVFISEDYAREVITQNYGQFKNRYSEFVLTTNH